MKLSRLFYKPFPRNYWPITLPWRWGRMLTNPAIWPSRLQWNERCMCGALNPRFILHIDVEILTNALSIWGIFGRRKEIHELIMDLHNRGYLDKDIAKIMNDRNIPTSRNKLWFAKHVWAARNYLRKRKARQSETTWKITRIFCEFHK